MSTSNIEVIHRENKKKASVRYKLLIFSIILFLGILTVGGIAFVISMQEITNLNKKSELQQLIEIERIKLEASVNGEIAIAVKMADSPIIQRYFLDPSDKDLEKIAFEEIAGYRRAFAGNTVFWVNDIDKKFYSDDAYAYTVDVNDPSNYWYKMTMYETEKFNFNINYNPSLKKIMLWINAPVFDEKGGRKPIGILGTGIDLTAFTNSVYKDYSHSADLYFFNSLGEITGAKDINIVANKTHISDFLSDTGNDMLSHAKNLSPGQMHSYTAQDKNIAIGTVPALGWYIAAIHKISPEDYLKNNMTVIFISIIIAIALIFVIFNVFTGKLLKPLKKMMSKLNEISSDWDLTNSIEVKSKDEIGTMANSLNNLISTLKSPIAETKMVVEQLASSSKGLSSVSNDLSVSSEETASTASSVASTTEEMSVNINAMASSAKQASVNANEVAGAAEQMSSNMNTIAAAIEEMSASISEISSNADDAHKVALDATAKSNEATSTMNKLGAAAKEIGQVTDVIKKIADKTNLLALNATIEAASAGNAGKGFAVVASEIKELANQSAVSADDIAQRIDSIQDETNNAVDVIRDVSDIIAKINQSIEAIAGHVGQQTKASNEIASNVAQASTGAKRVASAIGEVAKGSRDIARNASEAATGATNVSQNVYSMRETAHASSEGVSHLNSSAENLLRMAEHLRAVMSKFKV
jgi:methyl-accepting chemotaxis protein